MTLIHEVLHQWLGNVASIEWWSDIWITEALVTYLEHKIYQVGVRNYPWCFQSSQGALKDEYRNIVK